jgi:hypothetical protein
MCQNEYSMSHDRNGKTAAVINVDKEVAYKVEIELLKRHLAEKRSQGGKCKVGRRSL